MGSTLEAIGAFSITALMTLATSLLSFPRSRRYMLRVFSCYGTPGDEDGAEQQRGLKVQTFGGWIGSIGCTLCLPLFTGFGDKYPHLYWVSLVLFVTGGLVIILSRIPMLFAWPTWALPKSTRGTIPRYHLPWVTYNHTLNPTHQTERLRPAHFKEIYGVPPEQAHTIPKGTLPRRYPDALPQCHCPPYNGVTHPLLNMNDKHDEWRYWYKPKTPTTKGKRAKY